MVGARETTLIVVRGNSGSGKTTLAHALQRRRGRNQVAVISQDVVRRDVLWSDDHPGNPSVAPIDLMARDLSFEETLRRHATKAKAGEFGEAEMREWWYGTALVDGLDESTLRAEDTLDAAVQRIEADCGWVDGPVRREGVSR